MGFGDRQHKFKNVATICDSDNPLLISTKRHHYVCLENGVLAVSCAKCESSPFDKCLLLGQGWADLFPRFCFFGKHKKEKTATFVPKITKEATAGLANAQRQSDIENSLESLIKGFVFQTTISKTLVWYFSCLFMSFNFKS